MVKPPRARPPRHHLHAVLALLGTQQLARQGPLRQSPRRPGRQHLTVDQAPRAKAPGPQGRMINGYGWMINGFNG